MTATRRSKNHGWEWVRQHGWKLVFAIVLILWALFPLPAWADLRSVRFETLSVEDGLSQNAVLTIAQDAQGFLWFGTEDGLNQYDGYQFTVFEHDPEDPSTLIDNFVSKIFVDHEGEIWIGTRSGLDRFDRGTRTFTHYTSTGDESSGFLGTWVISIFEDSQGGLWVGTEEGGLNRFDRSTGTFTHFQHEGNDPSAPSDNAIRVIFEDRANNLWIATHEGLDLFDRARETIVEFEPESGGAALSGVKDVSVICEDDQGRLWLGTDTEEDGLFLFDPISGALRHYAHDPEEPDSLSHNRVRAVYLDHLGQLWVGTQNGLNLLSTEQVDDFAVEVVFQKFYHDPFDPDSLSSNVVWSVFEDQGDVLWFGTWGGGLSKYNRSTDRFRLYQHKPNRADSLSDNTVWSLAEDSRGRVWVGTLNGGLNRLDREADEVVVYQHNENDPGSLLNNDVRALLEDSSGRLWVGTAGGLDLYQPETDSFEHFTYDEDIPTSLSGPRVNVLLESSDGSIWVGTRYSGLNLFDPVEKKFRRFRYSTYDPNSISDDRIWALYEDRKGALWVGTLGGVSVLGGDREGFERFRHNPDVPGSLSEDAVFAFAEDFSGTMWVGTWGGGLERFDPDTQFFTHFTEQEGLPNNTIYGIEVDSQGMLWMSTNEGLSKFDPVLESFENYDVRDGLQNNEFNVGAHAKSDIGEMFFGGIRGFNAFFPQDVKSNENIPPVVITTVYVSNEAVHHNLLPGALLELSYKDDPIAFEFAALDYDAPADNQYAYMLEGFDEDWVDAGTRRYVSYTNLSGGEYVLRVKGSNSDGVWNEEGVTLSLTVTPPFWETNWFRGIILLAIVLIGVTGYQLRVRAVEARSRRLESLVHERTREIDQRRNELDALYRADEELFRTLEVGQVFKALVEIAVDITGADQGALLVWDDLAGELKVRSSKGFQPESLACLAQWLDEDTMASILENGQSIVVTDVRGDLRVHQEDVQDAGVHSFIYMPIKIRDDIYGVLNVAHTEPRAIGTEEQRLIAALAQRAALAIEQAQLQEQAQQTAVFEERQRLARDLHDAVTQTLFSASLIADVLPTLWEKDPEIGQQRLEVLKELTRGALAEMRTLLIELRPSAIGEADLKDLMRQLAESTTGRARIPVDLRVEGKSELNADEKVVIYRIAQEALNNVIKHAEANQVLIRLTCDHEQIDLSIEDDGVGFDFERVQAENLGLRIMQERATKIGAALTFDSEPGEGTHVRLLLTKEGRS